MSDQILTVSQYLDRINSTLKGESAKVLGEVNGLKLHQNGHYYFSILDKTDQSKIDCVIWRSNYKLFGVELKDGIEVMVSVVPNIYKLNGRISFIVNSIELFGEGALKIAYEKLKRKFEEEGLFSELRKRKIPDYPHRIGVITSRSGAVIHDFQSNLGRYGYEINFVDSKVEGQDAIKELLNAVNTLKDKNIDVLVVMRGGGSLESFQAFNNEILVRAIADFPAPVITGIGHDKDSPLVSMVSDKNVSTPTAVANLLNTSWKEAVSLVSISEEKIFSKYSTLLQEKKYFIENSIIRIERGIKSARDNFVKLQEQMSYSFENLVQRSKDFLVNSKKTLELVDPRKQLGRGYSILRLGSRVVKSVKNVKKGDKVDIMLSDGTIKSQII